MSRRRRQIDTPSELEESAKRRAKALYPWRWSPGRSGNPHGVGLYQEARQLARQAGAAVMERLIDLALHAEDERVSSVCCVAVLDRAYGRPREAQEQETAETRLARMTREERLAYMASLLKPMEAYLSEPGEEENTIEGEAALSAGNPSRRLKPSERIGTGRDRSVTGD
jgi:hypothetical protein